MLIFSLIFPVFDDYGLSGLLETVTSGESVSGETTSVCIELYRCDCGKVYKYKRSLQTHLRYECGKEPQFQCPLCEKRCHQKQALKTHIVSKHRDDVPLKSRIFGKNRGGMPLKSRVVWKNRSTM